MSNEKRLKCDNINNNITYSRYCINFEIKMRIKNEKEMTVLKKKLFSICFMI